MNFDSLKDNVNQLFNSMAEGWRHLTETAGSALTRFRSGEEAGMPQAHQVDGSLYLPTRSWAMLGCDVFEDERRVVVRLEVPGMSKQDLKVEVEGDELVVSGEKRFEQTSTEGRWRIMQCAYGSFRRVVALPSPVNPDLAHASYADGVLKVELSKREPGTPRAHTIEIA